MSRIVVIVVTAAAAAACLIIINIGIFVVVLMTNYTSFG